MPKLPDHFQLFNLPPRFALDTAELDRAYREVQSQVHPDRFAAGTAAESRVAMQWATRANEAYQTLKSPLKRAAYLCEGAGVSIDAESNTAMPSEFLVQQLEWREALDDARDACDSTAMQKLSDETTAVRDDVHRRLEQALDSESDFPLAATLVRQLMFIEKFASEISAAHDAMTGNQRAA
ncbi:MAG: Fe-S protein assembly co-chaperone HscB [Burkholderiaceae bacterium]